MAPISLSKLRYAVQAGVRAFQEKYFVVDTLAPGDFEDFEARKMRYSMLWSFYENSAYRTIHAWSTAMQTQYGLYKYTRGLLNPSTRLGDFYSTHVWGGPLDQFASNNDDFALPIQTENDALFGAIDQLFKSSNFPVLKDLVPLYGSILGDVILKIEDDPESGEVWLDMVHPGLVKEIVATRQGHIKAYTLEYPVPHPEKDHQIVTYREECFRGDGDEVRYETYLNNRLYPWNGVDSQWTEDYGMIPMVAIQHKTVGLKWGWSELHSGLDKVRELDDLASKVSDHLRKNVDPMWLFAGVRAPGTTPKRQNRSKTVSSDTGEYIDAPQPGREEIPAIYAPSENADAKPLVTNMAIPEAIEQLRVMIDEIERDYPELQESNATESSGGPESGRARRIKRQRAETKTRSRRQMYDANLVRAIQIAVAIGGDRGYEGYGGFNLRSYDGGKLDMTILDRPVFAEDTMDRLEEKKTFWETVKAAVETGQVPVEAVLQDLGWDAEQLAEFGQQKAAQILIDQEDEVLPFGQ